jgi:hypothetical protein
MQYTQLIDGNSQEDDRFEYDTLPCEQRDTMRQITAEIDTELRKTAEVIWTIGEKLQTARSILDPTQFGVWLETEFEWSRRTAYNFINVYEAFPELSSANFAQLDISASALYLLAAPSTDLQMRSEFLQRAAQGEKITHKEVKESLLVPKTIPTETELPELEILPLVEEPPSPSSDLHPGWNKISGSFFLFWGDLNSPRFNERLPQDAFIVAQPTQKWHNEWLLHQSRSSINLTKANFTTELMSEMLSLLAEAGKGVVFPWLPHWKMVELAMKLNLTIYSGDPDLEACEKTIRRLGFKLMGNS